MARVYGALANVWFIVPSYAFAQVAFDIIPRAKAGGFSRCFGNVEGGRKAPRLTPLGLFLDCFPARFMIGADAGAIARDLV